MKFKKGLIVLFYIGMLLGCLGMVLLLHHLSGGEGPEAEPGGLVYEESPAYKEPQADEKPSVGPKPPAASPSEWSPADQEQPENSQEAGNACEGKRNQAACSFPAAVKGTREEPEISAGEEPQKPPALMLASDLHFVSRDTHDEGEAFRKMMEQDDGKLGIYSEEMVDALVEDAIRTCPSALVLAGDITLNGEKANHQGLAGKLRRVREAGIPVLVIPGNHDIQNRNAATYFGAERQVAEYLRGAEDFLEIYREFGYDQALSQDHASLSYVYPLDEGHWMIMLDSCQYEDKNHVSGRIRPETLAWMEQQLALAKEAGAVVVPVAHHNLLPESRLYKTDCTMENHLEVIRLLEKYEAPLFVSGHLHAQRIKKHKAEPGVPEDAYGITEIVLGPYSIPPCQYGYLAWDEEDGMAFETRQADVSGMAKARGSEDEFLLDFAKRAPEYMKKLIQAQVRKTIYGVPEDLKEPMSRLYAEVYYDYCAGYGADWKLVENTTGYQLWQRVDPGNKFVGEMKEMGADGRRGHREWRWEQEENGWEFWLSSDIMADRTEKGSEQNAEYLFR